MSDRIPEPSELIYSPRPSVAPILVAAGLAASLAGLITFLPYTVIGVILILAGVRSWIAAADDEISGMRRHQRTATAVIPAEPIRRRDG